MNSNDWLASLVESVHNECTALLVSKVHDYAKDDNVFQNFQHVHMLCKILDVDPRRSPSDAAMYLVLLKIDRWCNLRAKNVSPMHESKRGTVVDLHNYIDLTFGSELDSEQAPS